MFPFFGGLVTFYQVLQYFPPPLHCPLYIDRLIALPHLLVWATNEQNLPTRTAFSSSLVNDSHRMQLMLVGTVHYCSGHVLVTMGGLKVFTLDNVGGGLV